MGDFFFFDDYSRCIAINQIVSVQWFHAIAHVELVGGSSISIQEPYCDDLKEVLQRSGRVMDKVLRLPMN